MGMARGGRLHLQWQRGGSAASDPEPPVRCSRRTAVDEYAVEEIPEFLAAEGAVGGARDGNKEAALL